MSFFKILIAVCQGTEIFPFLVRIPLIKALFHFFMLAFACTVFIVAARTIPTWQLAYAACETLNNEFGSFLISKDGMLPGKEPGQSRAVMVSQSCLVDYQTSKALSPKMEDDSAMWGIIWTPAFLGTWKKVKADSYILTPIVYDMDINKLPWHNILDKAQLEDYISKSSIDPKSLALIFGQTSLLALCQIKSFLASAPFLAVLILGTLFGIYLFTIISSTILFGSIFSIVYAFMKDSASKISGINIFVITLYASFPPVIIASLFPALELPFLDYQTVHMITLLVYLFVVFNKVQQAFAPPKKDDDEIDF